MLKLFSSKSIDTEEDTVLFSRKIKVDKQPLSLRTTLVIALEDYINSTYILKAKHAAVAKTALKLIDLLDKALLYDDEEPYSLLEKVGVLVLALQQYSLEIDDKKFLLRLNKIELPFGSNFKDVHQKSIDILMEKFRFYQTQATTWNPLFNSHSHKELICPEDWQGIIVKELAENKERQKNRDKKNTLEKTIDFKDSYDLNFEYKQLPYIF
jgi:hypothetical protein